MTDTTRDAFEAWFLAYRKGTWRPLSSDPRKDMPKHWNTNCEMDCWEGWQAATEQGKRQPLSDDELRKFWEGHTVPVFGKIGINPIVFARAIEAAHGITATPQGRL